MALPGITQTIRDGALGLLALGSDYHVKCGLCTDGPIGEAVAASDPETVRSTFGRGPLVESMIDAIARTGNPVIGIRVTQATAGAVGTITQSDSGPLLTASGSTPEDAFDLRVEVLVGGAVGTAEFRYSLDGGDTWSPAIATAATYAIPDSGITLQFPVGTYVAGEVYSAACTAPAFDTTGLAASMDVAFGTPQQWRLLHVVGYAASASDSATIAAAVAAKMAEAAELYRYAYAVLEMADDTDANLISAFASFADTRVMLCAGFAEAVSAVSGRIYKRPAAWSIVARIMSVAVSRSPGAVQDGGLDGIVSLLRDEDKTPGLEAARFCVLRTFKGRPGFFVTNGRMAASLSSDYQFNVYRQVMDVASRVAYEGQLPYVNVDLLTNDAGTLHEVEARRIEARVTGLLRETLLSPTPPDASEVEFVVNRTDNILSGQTLRAKTRVRPKGYARFIENEIAFRNPRLEPPTP